MAEFIIKYLERSCNSNCNTETRLPAKFSWQSHRIGRPQYTTVLVNLNYKKLLK